MAVPPFRRVDDERALAQCLAATDPTRRPRVGALADAAAGTHLAVHSVMTGASVDGSDREGPSRNLCGARPRPLPIAAREHFLREEAWLAHRLEAFDGLPGPARKVAELFPDERLFGGSMFRTAEQARGAPARGGVGWHARRHGGGR